MILDYYYEVFSQKVADRLHEVGFERCKGGVMPSNKKWRGTPKDWMERIEERLTFERGIFEPLDLIILTDARPITGNTGMLETLLTGFFRALKENKAVMKDFYTSAVLMPTALSFFGNFKTEKSGEYKDMLNIKLLGWAPLILAVRMVAITNGVFETNTLKRIRLLKEMNVIKRDLGADLTDAYLVFVRFRILNQIGLREKNDTNTNYLRPDMLGVEEQGRLRKAMKTVEAFQKFIQETLLFGEAF